MPAEMPCAACSSAGRRAASSRPAAGQSASASALSQVHGIGRQQRRPIAPRRRKPSRRASQPVLIYSPPSASSALCTL